jgi:hypothetical protein
MGVVLVWRQRYLILVGLEQDISACCVDHLHLGAKVKGRERSMKLYNNIKENNHLQSVKHIHRQYSFFVCLLLFCFFLTDGH